MELMYKRVCEREGGRGQNIRLILCCRDLIMRMGRINLASQSQLSTYSHQSSGCFSSFFPVTMLREAPCSCGFGTVTVISISYIPQSGISDVRKHL